MVRFSPLGVWRGGWATSSTNLWGEGAGWSLTFHQPATHLSRVSPYSALTGNSSTSLCTRKRNSTELEFGERTAFSNADDGPSNHNDDNDGYGWWWRWWWWWWWWWGWGWWWWWLIVIMVMKTTMMSIMIIITVMTVNHNKNDDGDDDAVTEEETVKLVPLSICGSTFQR